MPGAAPPPASDLSVAVSAFLSGAPLPPGFFGASLGSYTALWRAVESARDADQGAGSANPAGEPLVLQGSDGSVYARDMQADHMSDSLLDYTSLERALQALQLRATGTTLALRRPPGHAVPAGAASIVTFRQWVTVRELAAMRAGGTGEEIWK